MSKCKTKAIQIDLCTSRQNQAYPEIIQVYSDIFKTLCDPAYLAPWHIQNPDICRSRSIFRTLAYLQICQRSECTGVLNIPFRTPVHSERWHIQNLRQNPVKHNKAKGYNNTYKLQLFSQYKLATFSTS